MYRNPCFARQLRRLTAAAYPEDGARGPTGSFVGAKTAEDRVYNDLGSLAAWPGHGKMLNVADEEDKPARTLKYESWSGDFPNGMTLPATSSSVAADVLEAKLNPPVNFHDRLAVGEYYTGLPNAFVGGVVDPLHRKCLHENHGISNDHAVYINPSAQNLAEAKHPSDTSTSPNYLEQNLSSTGPAAAIFQAPFTSERQTQGFAELPKIKGSVLSDARHPGRLEKEIKYHFSTCGALYDVHGTTGSTNDDEVNVGVVTDHAALALFWRNLLHPMRPKGFYENTDYSPMVQIYHAGGYTLERERVIEEFGGPKPQDLGIEHENFVLVDPYSKPATALVSGVLDVGACRDLAAYLNSLVLFDELDTLTLPGHATYDIKSNTVDVFINGPADLTASPFLYGAHHLTLSPDGLGRVWNGVTRSGAAADNYNLITKQGETVNTTTVLPRKINDPASAAKMRSFYTDASMLSNHNTSPHTTQAR